MTKPTTVDEYLAAIAHPPAAVAENIRPLIDTTLTAAGSALFHGHPVWGLGEKPGKAPICLLKAFPKYLTFGLWRGQQLHDPSGRLTATSRDMAVVKLTSVADIDAVLFRNWLLQALDLEISHRQAAAQQEY